MGIMGALSTSVSGLSAQSYALENISGNIANSQTVGFKRVNTSFEDLVPDSPSGKELAGSVSASSQLTNTLQGTLATTGVSTNMAISGDGYFVVAKNSGSVQTPSFSGTNLYTRRGDFTQTTKGYLVNGSGQYLIGTSYNPATGAVTGSSLSPFQIPTLPLPAKATAEIAYSGNLPSVPKPDSYDAATAGSELIDDSDYDTTTSPVDDGQVLGKDTSTFLKQSIPGGEITIYDSAGTPVSAQVRWAKVSNYAAADTTVTPNTPEVPATWMMFYQTNSNPTSSQVAWQSIGSDVTFDANGARTSDGKVTVSNFTVDGVTVGDVAMNFASGGITQYGNANGTASTSLDQNGYTSGSLSTVAIGKDGVITGSYTNGVTAKIGQVTIAHFTSDDGLKREDGGAFSETTASGTPSYGMDGTTLAGGSVEQSNTDISDEFSKMIVTQQAYSANTRVMSTAQQMLQDVINVIR